MSHKSSSTDRTWLSAKGVHVRPSQRLNPGVFSGRKFVKKANMWLEYECYNDTKETDKFEYK